MSNDTRITTKKLIDLPEIESLQDSDIILQDDGFITHKVKLSTLIQYIKYHLEISDYYAHQSTIDEADGIAPLDFNRKLPSDNIPFGKESKTVYEGSDGKVLEENLDNHILDSTKHIPSNGTTNNGKFLTATSEDGVFEWNNLDAQQIIEALGYTPGTSGGELITYTLTKEGKNIVLTGSNGESYEIEDSTVKLYESTGTNIDGTMTQSAITTAIKNMVKELESTAEPTTQSDGEYWVKYYE